MKPRAMYEQTMLDPARPCVRPHTATSVPASYACWLTRRDCMSRHCPEEEIAHGPAAWLWDYMRRSGASGFLLPLSGGADSSSTAAIVASMCAMVMQAISQGNTQVLGDAKR